MNQKGNFPEKDLTDLLITGLVWAVLCISIPLYHLYLSRKSQTYIEQISDYVSESYEEELSFFKMKIHVLEIEEESALKTKYLTTE